MALPTHNDGTAKALELNLPPGFEDWRLDDVALFEPGGFSVKGFKGFMAAYSNWSAAEVGALTVKDMKGVVQQISDKLELAAVPKASSAPS